MGVTRARVGLAVGGVVVVGLGLAGFAEGSDSASDPGPGRILTPPQHARAVIPSGIHKIRHVIIIMQENRSFDSISARIQAPTGYRCVTALHRCVCPTCSGVGASVRTTTALSGTSALSTQRSQRRETSMAAA